MQKIIVLKSIPGAGKSTWAKDFVSKDPLNWLIINNDQLREMFNGSVFSTEYEKMVNASRKLLIKEALFHGLNIIVDNLNINKRHFEDICSLAKSLNRDIEVIEKCFYIDINEAIERDSKRIGRANVGEKVIRKWWDQLGREQFKLYNPKKEVFLKKTKDMIIQDRTLDKAIISDIDGTFAIIGDRSPYDASNADKLDSPNEPVVKTIKLYHDNGYKIIFCSGREDKYEMQTRNFIEQYFGSQDYLLFMRKTDDKRKDAIVKEEIFRNNIEGKYYIEFALDDRDQSVNQWRELGFVCYQVAEGNF